jgi:hypothetical protein
VGRGHITIGKFIKYKTNEYQNKLHQLQWRERGKEEDQERDGKNETEEDLNVMEMNKKANVRVT